MTVGALFTPSATMCMLSIMSSIDRPFASSMPTWRLRLWGLVQVAIISPMPASPAKVSGLPPSAAPKRLISASPRVIKAARVLSPAPSPSPIPTAMAMMFFSTPPNSQPITSWLV